MATYKAEFLSHYYETHPRPPQARSMGMIHRGGRRAAHAPGLVNLVNRMPVLSTLGKRWAGVADARSMPEFAGQTFTSWFARRSKRDRVGLRVLLWPDTFNNHFHPESLVAATHVLEAAGYRGDLPKQALCCGRPLYDFGMLDVAKQQLLEIYAGLSSEIDEGTPIVGLEPTRRCSRTSHRICFPMIHGSGSSRSRWSTSAIS